jgi:hypothetical protein
MKRAIGMTVVLIVLIMPVWTVEREDFQAVVNFSLTLERLDAAAQRRIPLWQDDRLVILDGTVASVVVVDSNQESFLAELELVRGKWRGLDEVVMYRSIVQLRGQEFASLFSRSRRSRRPNPNALSPNTAVVVVGTVTGLREDPETGPAYVLDCVELRRVQ